jgi:predicted amino acid dehydrogenase
MPEPALFAFLVHPLTPFQRRVMGVRRGHFGAAIGLKALDLQAGELCRFGVGEALEGSVIALPHLPGALLEDQGGAVDAMKQVTDALEGVQAVGLGSLLAVVGGRGEELAGRVDVPITTGAAATAWAAAGNALEVARAKGEERVAVLGFGGAVGEAVARLLVKAGLEVLAVGQGLAPGRRAEELGVSLCEVEAALGATRVVVGAATSGGSLDPGCLQPGTVLVDVALPSTLAPGPVPPGVRILAGEAMELPPGWKRGFWGWLYHFISGYGPGQIYACLAEPLVMAAQGRTRPYARGRSVDPVDLEAFCRDAEALGLKPRLATGWSRVTL